ncbi:MAG: transcription elongation factor GreA [Clostridia bacterium]|nr:transcription elongation factor GreA [Clostridia bacterium]
MGEPIIVTPEGKKKLEDELEYLKTVKRQEVKENIKIARSFGDLSENSEYDEAKNEQAKTEGRILELEEMLKNVKVVSEDEVQTKTANVGNVVKVKDMKYKEEVEYIIVGSTEADPLNNKVSPESPIGSALIGAKVGESVTVATPVGEYKLKVLKISKQK